MGLDFNKFAAEGNNFINSLAMELGYPNDKARAGRVLKSILLVLRDYITIEESIQLLAQLPTFLKAVYIQNWSIHRKHKKVKHLDEFYEEIRNLDGQTAELDFPTTDDVSVAISIVFMELRKYISLGELEDIKAVLPKELKVILNNVLMI